MGEKSPISMTTPADTTMPAPPTYSPHPNHPQVQQQPCSHTTTPTPHLDAALRHPQARTALHSLIAALSALANDDACTECAVQETSKSLVGMKAEMKRAKKAGELNWSKEEKKAVKQEVKALFGRVKKDVKASKA